ncbi:glycosyltransferase [Geodermatophilus sp. SYSU D00708]
MSKVFYWCAGQDDNIGDIILRRRMLQTLQKLGPCHVYVGSASHGFIDALELRRCDRAYASFAGWLGAISAHALRHRAFFAFNPGEVDSDPIQGLMHLATCPVLALVRLRGGTVFRAGVGLRTWKPVWGNMIRLTARLSTVNLWRDDSTRDVVGRGGVAPDWAFDLTETTRAEGRTRRRLTVSMRGDEAEFSPQALSAVRALADSNSLQVTVVSQVVRDNPSAVSLGKLLDAEVVTWSDRDHAAQERLLQEIYRESRVVISDRLHVLLLGVACGAVPLGLMEHDDRKVRRTLEAAGLRNWSKDVRGLSTAEMTAWASSRMSAESELERAYEAARHMVRDIDTSILRSVSHERWDYLVGALRISLGPDSTTFGPRTHILGFLEGLEEVGCPTDIFLASKVRGLGRFARIRESDYATASRRRIVGGDVVRLAASVWSGSCLFLQRLIRPRPDVIYERLAVMQSLAHFHPWRRRAVVVLECNGIMSRESAKDRGAIAAVKWAERIERKALLDADLIVAVSDNLRAEILDFVAVPEASVVVVPNGISSDFLTVEIPECVDNWTIGFVGTVGEYQRIDRLVRATAGALPEMRAAAGKPIKVEIIGEGPAVESLRELVEILDVSSVVSFLGALPRDEVVKRISKWDAGYAGHERTSGKSMYHSPLKLYEYAACGHVIVATESNDATVLEGMGVPVFRFADEAELGRALVGACRNPRPTGESVSRVRGELRSLHGWRQRVELVRTAIADAKGAKVRS